MNLSLINNKLSRKIGLGLLFMGLVGGVTVLYYYGSLTGSVVSTAQVPEVKLTEQQTTTNRSTTTKAAEATEKSSGLSAWFSQQVKTIKNATDKAQNTPTVEISEQVLAEREAWAKMLAEHPFSNRPVMSRAEWKKIPKFTRPDLANEQDYLRTMDPALGYVPYERRLLAGEKTVQKMNAIVSDAAIPNVTWQERGPNNVGGRTRALMFDPNDATNRKVWAGGVSGGLWFTNDITQASTNVQWTHVSTPGSPWDNLAISSITSHPANNQIFYVGTGEGFAGGAHGGQFGIQGGSAVRGGGIWRSTNAGATWARVPNTENMTLIHKVVVVNSGAVFVATPNGLFRSPDGTGGTGAGAFVQVNAGNHTDLEYVRPAADAATHFLLAGIDDGSIIKSATGTAGTWAAPTTLLAAQTDGDRVELAVAPSNTQVIYALTRSVATGAGKQDILSFKKSTNGGGAWTDLTVPVNTSNNDGSCAARPAEHFTNAQAFFALTIEVSPTNPDILVVGGLDLHRSINGGGTFQPMSHWIRGNQCSRPYVHADQHITVFRPGASNEAIFGHDGGVSYSATVGNGTVAIPAFFDKSNTYNVTQFYTCAVRNEVNSNNFLGGTQDNGTPRFTQIGVGNTTEAALGGDGAFCHIDQQDGNIQISSSQNNSIARTLDGGATRFNSINNPSEGFFINPSEYDSQGKILYTAGATNTLRRFAGMNLAPTPTGVSISHTFGGQIAALKMSPYNSNVLFLAIANGRVFKVTNANAATPTFTEITGDLAGAGFNICIEVGASDDQLLLVRSNYGINSIFETTNGGTNWVNKDNGTLPDMPIRWAIYNPDNRNQVLLATETGVWSTTNFNAPTTATAPEWTLTSTALGNVRCDMLKYRPSDKMVVVATHGRGLFTSDVFVTTPVANFEMTPKVSCTGSLTVNFTDGSIGANNIYAWDVDNNGTTDYTTRNPTHTYAAPGVYSPKLTINNGAATITKTNEVIVMNAVPTAHTGCTITANSNNGNNNGIGISRFSLGTINNITPSNDGGYLDYACTQATTLALNTTYTITITTGTLNAEGAKVFIDYNDNGNFGDVGEEVASFAANTTGTRTANFTTPATATLNKGLRARIVSTFGGLPADACDNGAAGGFGQIEDYAVFFQGATPTITLSAAALTTFTACAGAVSTEQQYTVIGANLTANISIVPPTGFEISTGTGGAFVATNPITLTQTGGNVATTTIYVRQSAAAANGASGNITHTSAGSNNPARAIPTSTVTPNVTPTVNITPTTASAGSQTFTATAANIGGGTVAYDFQKNAVSQQNSAATTWNATGLVAGDVVRCVITITGGNCLTATTATSNTVTVTAAPTSTITLSAASLTAFTSCAGSVSTEQQYTVTGANLTANISIVPPTGFEISTGTGGTFVATNPITLTQTGGNVATTTIYVRQSAAAANGASGDITHTSTGATTQNRAIPASTVNALPAIGTQPTNQTICAGANTTFTVAATGAGLTYQWQEKVGAGAFANIANGGVYSGATTATLTLTGATAGMNTNQYQCIVSGTCTPAATSTAVTLTVNPLPAITTQPTAQSTCATGNATFTVAATGAGLTYQWQEKVGAGAFANITNGGIYGGATTATLTLTGVTAPMNTNQYQCVVSGTCTPAATSNAVALTVTAGTAINTQPTNQAGCVGGTVNFTTAASGSGTVTYQWQEKVGAGAFANITNGGIYSGVTTATLTLTGITAPMNTNQYQCIATSSCGNATTTAATLSINTATSVTTQPTPQTVCPTQNVTFTVAGAGQGTVTYQWQEKVGAGAFANITNGGVYGGATTATLTLTGVTAGMNTNQYQCIVTATCGNATSNAVALTVNAVPSITTQPTAQSACTAGNATFTVAATGAGLTYQWQEKVGAGAFANITNGGVYSGATSASLTLTGVTIGMNTNQYQCIVSGTCTPAVTSNAVALTVTAGLTIGTQPTPQTICATQNATFTVAATGSGITYQWQEKVGAGAFANITNGGVYGGATSASLTLTGVPVGMSTNQYQCVINSSCGNATSTAVALTVNAATTITTQPTAQTICLGSNATFTVAAAGAGVTYQWQEKVGAGAFANITNGGVYGGATSATLTLTNPAIGLSTNQYQCVITSSCGNLTSNAVALTINATPAIGTQPTNQTICSTGNATFTVAATGAGLTYQWQEKVGAGAFANITNGGVYGGATTASLTLTGVPIGMNTNQYQCIVSGTCTPSVTSNAVTLTVNAGASVTTQPTAQTTCATGNATFTVVATGTGLTYQWQEKVGAGAFTNITNGGVYAGATSATLTLTGVTAGMNTNQYQCVITAGCGSLNSNAVALTVNTAPTIGTQPTPQTVCANATATFTVAATGAGLTYQWQERVGAGAFANITNGGVYSGATSATLTLTNPAVTMSTNQYQCIVSGTCTPAATSTAVALTVTPVNATPTLNALTAVSLAVSAPAQTVNLSGIGMGAGDTGQTLTVTATSNNVAVIPNPTVTYTSPNATGSISFTPVANQTGTATITVTVTDNGGTACGAVNTISRTFVVDVGTPPPPPPARRSQTITFNAITDREFTNVPFGVVATASSNLPVTITVTSGNATINGQTLTLTGIGDITLTATQAGNNEFLAATPVSRTFKVTKATPSITFAAITDRAWNSGSFGISVSGTTGQPTVAITQGQTIATLVNNNTVNLNAAVGQVTITASLAETPNYNAVSVSRSFAVTKANQQINFPSLFVLRAGTTETLQATASSNLAVTYTVVSGNATLSGNTLSVTNAAAPIVISASQAGNDLWNAATTITQTVQVLKVEQTVSLNASVSPTISLGQSQTVNVTSSSNLPITIRVVSGAATINGLTITPTSTGLVVVEVIQLGNDVFNASQPIRLAFNVLPTITLANVNVTGTVCAGAEITVGYTTNGNFAAGNYFTLELSDEEGNFNGGSLGGQEGLGSGSFKLPIPRSLNRTGSRYRVRVVAYPSNVMSNNSNTFTINTLPAQPFITLNTDGKTLSSTSATGNQWYLAGIPIASATGQTFTPTQTGSYTLIVTQNGCSSIESPAYFYQLPTPTGVNDDNLAAGLSLFPNPTENKFVLEGTVEKAGVVKLQLTDALGRILTEDKVSTNGVQLRAEINMADYGAGVYFLTIESNGKTAIKRIVRH